MVILSKTKIANVAKEMYLTAKEKIATLTATALID